MADPLEQVLQLVADGSLTAAEAAPILDALGADDRERTTGDDEAPDRRQESATAIRIEVTEGGRRVLNLRVPVSLGQMALDRIPGLSGTNVDLVRQALLDGRSGTLLHIDDEGDGVRIALE
jgi:hypothetical protein